MKIAIISDTHDNLPNFKKALGWAENEGIKTAIHCGDVCREDTLTDALADFGGNVFLAKGNCDIEDFAKIPNVKAFDGNGALTVADKKLAFVHLPKTAKELAESGKYDIVFYGHTHKPWLETLRRGSGQATQLVNPGNLAGIFYKSTFAVYDNNTDTLELKILEKL